MKKLVTVALCLSMGALFSCAKKAGTGALIGTGAGAGVGAGVGAIVGGKKGAIIGGATGAMVGGTTGVIIGAKMDRQEEELKKQVENAEIERISENQINVKFDSGILFDTGSSNLKNDAMSALNGFAGVLKQYPENRITIEGHTDSTGTLAINQRLSEQRASSVRNQLQLQGVDNTRMTTMGYADSKPVADNTTADGRSKNRRVEIIIIQDMPTEE